MKKIYCIVCMFLPMVASADALDDKIARLTQEKLDKLAKLEQCQKSTKGLKIAGWTTLGISAIGIAANIGEAVELNKLDTKINDAQEQSEQLDGQINAIQQQKREQEEALLKQQQANNTCGVRECGTSKENFLGVAVGATDAVCVNATWFPTSCKEGYKGTQKTCKSNGQVVDYVLHCNKIEQNNSGDVIPDCGEQNKCDDLNAAQLLINLNATELVCVNGVSKPTDCYSQGEPTGKKQCKNGNVVITYYDACPGTSVKKTTRKNGDLCTDDESAKVLYAQETFWQNGKCVAKSCQDGKFLLVENGVSLGECVTACSSYQIIDWSAAGGKACDTSLQFNPTENCARKVFSRAEYTKNMCYGKCQGYAHENNCKLTGDPIENQQTGECICNPVPLDLKKPGGVVELPACQEQEVEKNSKSECDTHCTQYANNNKCKLTRGNTYYSDTKQCFCNAAAPRKREVEQKNLCSETSIVSVSASNCMSLCSSHASRNNCTVENTSWDGVNCYCNPAGGRPVADWDLVGTAVQQAPVPEKQDVVPTYLPNQFRGVTGNAIGLSAPAGKDKVGPASGATKPGRNMGGAIITYTTVYDAAKYDMIATITVDGKSYEAVAHVMAFAGDTGKARATEMAVKDKLKELGYSNYKLQKAN